MIHTIPLARYLFLCRAAIHRREVDPTATAQLASLGLPIHGQVTETEKISIHEAAVAGHLEDVPAEVMTDYPRLVDTWEALQARKLAKLEARRRETARLQALEYWRWRGEDIPWTRNHEGDRRQTTFERWVLFSPGRCTWQVYHDKRLIATVGSRPDAKGLVALCHHHGEASIEKMARAFQRALSCEYAPEILPTAQG